MMSLKVRADQTLAQFDAAEPDGADIVIVPAQIAPKNAALAAWVNAQARKGAVVMSICEGARVLANAGLLNGRRATTHWYAVPELEKAYPGTTWVRDSRYVQDGRVISTTGVTASIPASLALVEAVGGRATAAATAQRLGVAGWSAAHRTADYRVSQGDKLRILATMAAVWTHETVEAPVADGVDEIAVALTADAWGRSFRTKVVTTHRGLAPVRSRRGLVVLPDEAPRPGRFVLPSHEGPPAPQLDAAIRDVTRRYGPDAGRAARLGLEYDPPAS
jgi:transcriptional regulator GlxA family with amidase domain